MLSKNKQTCSHGPGNRIHFQFLFKKLLLKDVTLLKDLYSFIISLYYKKISPPPPPPCQESRGRGGEGGRGEGGRGVPPRPDYSKSS